MFSHAAAKGFVEVHPFPDLQRKHFEIKLKHRERFLNEQEIVELFRKLPDSGLPERAQSAIIVLLVTGQRTQELRLALWQDVDLDGRLWVIPGENSKNGKPHKVHLSNFAINHFKILREYSIGDLVMGSYRKPDEPITDKTLAKQLKDRQREKALKNRSIQNNALLLSGGPWSLHCLRHTAATHMNGMNIPPYIVEKILNHTMPGIMAVYNHQDYLPEREDALDRWGEHLDRLKNAQLSNVVNIRVRNR